MKTRRFHIGDILSITTGKLVSPRGMEGVYDILNFMTDDDLYTHQLPRAAEECRPYLLEQFPQLREVDASEVTPENWRQWLDKQARKYGEELEVKPLPEGVHVKRNPIIEAVEMHIQEK